MLKVETFYQDGRFWLPEKKNEIIILNKTDVWKWKILFPKLLGNPIFQIHEAIFKGDIIFDWFEF